MLDEFVEWHREQHGLPTTTPAPPLGGSLDVMML